jgi:hypothetical protein
VVDEEVMSDALARCAVSGSACRLLQLEASGSRPVWAVLDAAGARHFTGEVTLLLEPTVRVYFNSGELYFAERDGDRPIAERLVTMHVLDQNDLDIGMVRLGELSHLGRLFDRVPAIDRDRVEVAVELVTSQLLGEIADHVVDEIKVASYRHHPTGLVRWFRHAATTSADRLVDDGAVNHDVTWAPAGPEAEGDAAIAAFEASLSSVEAAPIETAPTEPALAATLCTDHLAVAAPIEVERAVAVSTAPASTPDETGPRETVTPPIAAAPRPRSDANRLVEWSEVDHPTVEMATFHDLDIERIAAESTPAEPAWVIDDRVDWHGVLRDTGRVPIIQIATEAEPLPAPEPELDVAALLAKVAGESDDLPNPTEEFRLGDDVRAAVMAALAEIESTSHTQSAQGAHETVPPVLMQAALSAEPEHTHPAPWLPERPTANLPVTASPSENALSGQKTADDQPGIDPVPTGGLRRLIPGAHKS